MDSLRIAEEAPELYAKRRREREMRAAKIRKIANYILAGCAAALVLFCVYTYVGYRIEARNLLRQAKNVELSIRLVGIEYYGYSSNPYDSSRMSGLKKDAEAEVVEHAMAEGDLRVFSWEKDNNEPTCFSYQEGDMVAVYRKDKSGETSWEVCRLQKIIDVGETTDGE